MKQLGKLVIGLGLVAAVAAPALAGRTPRECVRLTQQIARYQRDAGWARERGNAGWESASLDQIERLARRRAKRCPAYREQESLILKFAALAAKASKLAARYYLMGI